MRKTKGQMTFAAFNYIFLVSTALLCLAPIVNILAKSFSVGYAVEAGKVGFIPVEFTLEAYKNIIKNVKFIHAMFISFERVVIGTVINLVIIVISAYPLSKNKQIFPARQKYIWVYIICMMFGGGLIPTYMVVRTTGLMNTIWALIVPGAVQAFNIVLMMNFFKAIPRELEESAFIDGARHLRTLWSIYVPLSKPAIATIVLFASVHHWNAWFDGLLYMNSPEKYPLQSYLQTVIITTDSALVNNKGMLDISQTISQGNNRAAQIFLAMIPILMVYPFLQKHFAKGIMLGGVKG
jgi:putative aldouronate transport system permease protein